MSEPGAPTLLDDLSGHEFEAVMVDVFRHLGYENVRQAPRVADEGRDVLMAEAVDGEQRAVVVECKHTDTVGRPAVQKLHSAVATYEFDGPARGIAVTTGRFTGPAQAYVEELRESDDPYPIDLIDGGDLRALADDVGLDLYNGRIEILCDRTLRPFDPARGPAGPILDAFQEIRNLSVTGLPEPELWLTVAPILVVSADVDATFETSVGVIHRIAESETLMLRADRGGPNVPGPAVERLVRSNLSDTIELDKDRMRESFDQVTRQRFGRTETEYKDWAIDQLCRDYATTVRYTGDNNVTYTKECVPSASDVTVREVRPVYLPRIRASVERGEYAYPYEYFAAGDSREILEDGVRRCIQCGDTDDSLYTYCDNCGSINCRRHTKTERLEGEPICTGCAVTERFFLRRKYFYDEANLDQFREEFAAMPLHRKALENKPLVAATAAVTVFLVVASLLATGVV